MIEKILSQLFKGYRQNKLREKLKSAIKTNNFPVFQEILQDCISEGVDLNRGFGPSGGEKYIQWSALWLAFQNTGDILKLTEDHPRKKIIDTLLDARDHSDCFAIDLTRPDGRGIIHLNDALNEILVMHRITEDFKEKEKLPALLEVREQAMGALLERVLKNREGMQIDQQTIMDLLSKVACDNTPMQKTTCLKILLSFFKEDIISINGLFPDGKTLLDRVMDKNLRTLFVERENKHEIQKIEELQRIIQEAGGKTTLELIRSGEVRRRIINNNQCTTPTLILTRLSQNVENTHWYTKTSAASLNNLKKMYRLDKRDIVKSLSDIRNYLSQSFQRKQIDRGTFNKVNARLDKIEGCKERIAFANDISLRETLAIVWKGVTDKNAIPALEGHENPNEYVKNRKETFIKDLFELHNGVCSTGMFNAMVGTLNQTHPLVTLIPVEKGAESDYARSAAQGNVVPFVTRLLTKESLKDQKEILSHWDDREEKEIVARFRKEAKEAYTKFLDKDASYARFLDPYDRNNILEGFEENLPRPTVHKELDVLIEEIKKIPVNEKSPPIVSMLKTQAADVYSSDRTFQEEHKSLKLLYDRYKQLESFTVYFTKKQQEERRSDFVQFWLSLVAPNTNRVRKEEVGEKVVYNLRAGQDAYDQLDEEDKVTAQTGKFSIALKCK